MRNLDFSSWQGLISTLLGLAVITLLGVGIRLLVMQAVQQRRERQNRQINERLRTLIAAYKVLGGSFTGNLAVDPAHLRDIKNAGVTMASPSAPDAMAAAASVAAAASAAAAAPAAVASAEWQSTDRSRRIRDAVEASLADIILLGTEAQVRLAAAAATELAAGRPAHTADLVVSLRDFIRAVLDLDSIPSSMIIPQQGPARPGAKAGGGKADGDKDSAKAGGGQGMGGAGGGGANGNFSVEGEHESHHD